MLGLWVRLEDDQIVGHMVGTIQQWDGENVAWIHQAENDGAPMDQEFWNRSLAELTQWVRDVNASLPPNTPSVHRMMFSTPHDPRLFERRAGFRVYRHLMERKV